MARAGARHAAAQSSSFGEGEDGVPAVRHVGRNGMGIFEAAEDDILRRHRAESRILHVAGEAQTTLPFDIGP